MKIRKNGRHTIPESGANIELKDTNSLIFYDFVKP
jgi:hypothetical protein